MYLYIYMEYYSAVSFRIDIMMMRVAVTWNNTLLNVRLHGRTL